MSFLAHISKGAETEGQRVLASAIAQVTDWRGAADCFEEALVSSIGSTEVIDQVAFADAALGAVPREAVALVARVPSMRAAIHMSIAIDSARSAWSGVALAHLRQVAHAAPRVLGTPAAWQVVARCGVGAVRSRNRRILDDLKRIAVAFQRAGVETWLVGTLAISLHARTFVKNHGDIDLVTDDPDDFARALALLTGPLGYRLATEHAWTAYCGRQARLTVLSSRQHAGIELAYLPHWADSGNAPLVMPHGPQRARQSVMVDGVAVWTMDLADLRNLYAWFLVENAGDNAGPKRQNDKNAILAIDRVIATAARPQVASETGPTS